MAAGKRSGTGIYENINGDIYLGEWQDDCFSGEGIYIFSSNERYEGEITNGAKHGEGTYYYLSGAIYRGSWLTKANTVGEFKRR